MPIFFFLLRTGGRRVLPPHPPPPTGSVSSHPALHPRAAVSTTAPYTSAYRYGMGAQLLITGLRTCWNKTQKMHTCCICGRPFTTKANLAYHAAMHPETRSDTVAFSGNAAIGRNRAPHPLVHPGSNIRSFMRKSYPPRPDDIAAASALVCAMGAEAGRIAVAVDQYQQMTVSVAEADDILSVLCGARLSDVLASGLVRHRPGTPIHVYHTGALPWADGRPP